CQLTVPGAFALFGYFAAGRVPGAQAAGQQDGDGDDGEQGGDGGVEQPGVDAVDECGAGGRLDWATGVDGQGERATGPARPGGGGDDRQVQTAAVGGGDDAADDRDAQRAADLTGQVVQRRSDALLGSGQPLGNRGGGGGHRRAHAGPERDQAGQQQP